MTAPVIAVWSPKGGAGKTVIAAGLAFNLHRRCEGGALLIDLDAGKADLAPLLKVSLHPNLLEYPEGSGRTVQHPTGLQVLPGAPRLIDEGLVTAELADAVIRRSVTAAGAVVLDLDGDLRDSTLIALDRADAVLLVTTPDLLSIYACRRFAQEAAMIGLDLRKFRLVINRVSLRQEIPEAEILDLIGVGLAARVPELPGLTLALNRGMISTLLRTNTEYAVAMHLLAERLAYAGIPAAGRTPAANTAQRLAAAASTRGTEAGAGAPRGLLASLRRWWQAL